MLIVTLHTVHGLKVKFTTIRLYYIFLKHETQENTDSKKSHVGCILELII
jgi:hypothetical protein